MKHIDKISHFCKALEMLNFFMTVKALQDKNLNKPWPSKEDVMFLLDGLKKEVVELEEAINTEWHMDYDQDVSREAADVANYCAMIAGVLNE